MSEELSIQAFDKTNKSSFKCERGVLALHFDKCIQTGSEKYEN